MRGTSGQSLGPGDWRCGKGSGHMNVRDVFHVVDLHAGGEPLRLILDGYPPIPGRSMMERRAFLKAHLDHYRQRLMWEPWGHEDMYGCLLLRPEREDSQYGLIFMHNEGYSTMCGHAILAVTRFLVESGRAGWDGRSPAAIIRFDVPSGVVEAHAVMKAGRVAWVWFENVPAWTVALDEQVTVDGRSVRYDIGYGGAFYALKAAAARIKDAIHRQRVIVHPEEPRIAGLYGVIFTDPPRDAAHQARHVTVFADRQVDRSPCGSCVSARLAVEYVRGRLRPGEPYAVESILDTVLTGEVLGPGPDARPTVRTKIAGMAYVIGFRRFFLDPSDPLPPFLVR